jgi:methionyl aminopeptidase
MRTAGRLLAEVAAIVREATVVGATPRQLDALAEREIRARNAVPCFKGYTVEKGYPFPAAVCVSPNDVVVHGIPDDRPFRVGDLVSVDFGLIAMGYHADMAWSVGIGAVSAAVTRLLDATERSLYEGVARARPGNRIGDIGHAVEQFIQPHRFGIVRDFVGHGIGRRMHEPPSVPNVGRPGQGQLLKPGMCLAIEPMITLGSHETRVAADRWTVRTADGSLAAHFEHTVAVTPTGPEILTVLPGDDPLSRVTSH